MSKNQTVLFHSTVFGPVHSRRLGVSLGINLLPNYGKICSFDCIYCEAGFNSQGHGNGQLPTLEKLAADLDRKLHEMSTAGEALDVITFSGNGEPTLHPQFPKIVDTVIALRDLYFPLASVSVLSNSTRIMNPEVVAALRRVDNNILKLDSAIESTMRIIDRPISKEFSVASVIKNLSDFRGECIIQTMLLRGEFEGKTIDNTTDLEIIALIEAYRKICPRQVMIYTIDRPTPAENLVKLKEEELLSIGERIERETGIKTQVNA